ncbi:ATP-binding protein [Streptomyces sp. NPDC005283]|uniref:ATP-binding protein n=1 Tax=Streptomyces sp. NPDC005283 TaxID=3156871 RepID=UPI003453C8A4
MLGCWRGARTVQGRAEERRHIERMLANSRRGASSSLLLHGEAGIGKTTLLEHAAAHADGMRVGGSRASSRRWSSLSEGSISSSCRCSIYSTGCRDRRPGLCAPSSA